jgi:hypothetical protein
LTVTPPRNTMSRARDRDCARPWATNASSNLMLMFHALGVALWGDKRNLCW